MLELLQIKEKENKLDEWKGLQLIRQCNNKWNKFFEPITVIPLSY